MAQLRTVLMMLAETGAEEGYEMVLPLGTDGRLDAEAWQADPAACTVRGFAPGQPEFQGRLVLGSLGWRIEPLGDDATDAPALRLDLHTLRPGEHVTLSGGGGGPRAYRIVAVR